MDSSLVLISSSKKKNVKVGGISRFNKIAPSSRKIFEGEINEFFVQHLGEINKKMSYFNAPPSNNIYALKEVGPELERIRCRVN
jgi:hypothetical protein